MTRRSRVMASRSSRSLVGAAGFRMAGNALSPPGANHLTEGMACGLLIWIRERSGYDSQFYIVSQQRNGRRGRGSSTASTMSIAPTVTIANVTAAVTETSIQAPTRGWDTAGQQSPRE